MIGARILGMVMLAGLASTTQALGQPAEKAGTYRIHSPLPIGEFTLQDQHGHGVIRESMRGKLNLVVVGYTSCPDICPMTLHNVKRALSDLSISGSDFSNYQVWFVSVDPARDTPDKLEKYLNYFDQDFRAVTGTHRQLAGFLRSLGLYYRIQPHRAGDLHYLIDHSAEMIVIDGDLNRVASIQDTEPELLVKTLASLYLSSY